MICKGEKHVVFENERRKLTIFFSDIKGFTDTTDSMEAEELSNLLNEYLVEMTKIAHAWGGTIDTFTGDAIMIFLGASETTDEKDQTLRCVRMAVAMKGKMKELKECWFNAGIEYPLEIRIGINTGTTTVGNFGAEDRLSHTAIGGQVNLASRFEEFCPPGRDSSEPLDRYVHFRRDIIQTAWEGNGEGNSSGNPGVRCCLPGMILRAMTTSHRTSTSGRKRSRRRYSDSTKCRIKNTKALYRVFFLPPRYLIISLR